jgi:hypothetical protein
MPGELYRLLRDARREDLIQNEGQPAG